ncbi:MAG TPA: glycosyltransferase family 87 protein [Terracidiphilus sp.]|nr:glycosyltransferase family 87 protein [Terracidiphilus sp.]
MTRARLDGLCLLLLGSTVLLLLSIALHNAVPAGTTDFKPSYFSARCLIQHGDPYSESEVLRIYRAEGGAPLNTATARQIQIATRYVYPPTAFSLTVPFAMLPWGPANMLWIALTAGSLIFASFLAWDLGANYSPILSGALIGFLLANSQVLMILGNPSGIAISLCVAAVWCFLRERFVPAGILCLALSLAVKPQDAGLVWLYFLLAGGVYRKRALQTLLATVAISLPCVLWVWRVAPHWIQELHSNVSAFAVHGGLNDPGFAATGGRSLDMLISLQTAVSFFRDDPRIYNPVSYLICGSLLLLWAFVILRSRSSPRRAWLAIAVIAPLSVLPVHHHLYDAKLLLLTIPACAMLWAEGGLIGRLALLVNSAGLVLTGDLSWAIYFGLTNNLYLSRAGMSGQILTAVQVFTVPLILLVMGVFYLWVYLRRTSGRS